LDDLRVRNLLFECSCSRLQLADEDHYPGHCRKGPTNPALPTATRLRVEPGSIGFADIVQGGYRQDVALAVGDFILKRRDHIFAYVLAVVVDDAAQGITHVVRGADLLDNTPRQIYLQRILGLPTPEYAHVPVLVEADGSKLAKLKRSVRLDPDSAVPQLALTFDLLGLAPPSGLIHASLAEGWRWAMENWDIGHVPRRLSLPA
jgi:glutamyl-Q tRNA(Asp) synthetase